MTPTTPCDEKVKAAARDWFARTVLETPTPHTRAEFEAWQSSNPVHARVYARYLSIWEDSAQLTDLAPLLDAAPAAPTWRAWTAQARRGPLQIAAAVAIAAVGLLLWRLVLPHAQHFATAIAQVRELTLADGTHVVLGAKSDLEVSFAAHERRAILHSGEAFFEVAADAGRPFVVDAGLQQVRVLGTSFDLRRANDTLRVAVLNGTVAVGAASGAAGPKQQRTVGAGQQVEARLDATQLGAVRPLAMPDPTAWRHGRLEYVDAPLREIIADANRYSSRHYVIAQDALANERVSVSYESGKVDQMVAGLSRALPVTFRNRDGEVLIAPQTGR